MKRLLVCLFSFLTLGCTADLCAQVVKDKDFYHEISNYDLSKIIAAEHIIAEDAELLHPFHFYNKRF